MQAPEEKEIFAIDFQLVGTSYVYNGAKMEEFKDTDKLLKKIEALPIDCTVITEMGGAVDPVVLTIADRGIEIWTMPATFEQQARDEYGLKKSEDAKALYQMFQDKAWRSYFYRHETDDDTLLELCDYYGTYTKLIKDRVALQNAITATYRRAAIRGRQVGQSVSQYVKEKCANNPAFAATIQEEQDYLKKIEQLVATRPEYTHLLEPIAGVGPRIASGIITGVRKASRFVAPDKSSFKITRERALEYCGLGGQAINENFLASRRSARTADVGVPQLKADLFLLADQFNRQPDESPMKALINVHRIKAWTTMLDELLNSPERANTVFTLKGKNGEKTEAISPRKLSHLRALRMAKIVFIGDYYLQNLLALEDGKLGDEFDAQEELQLVAQAQIIKDSVLIAKHTNLRLARLPYKKGGRIPFGNWLNFAELNTPSQLADLEALEQKVTEALKRDVQAEMEDIRQKLEYKKMDKASVGESFGQLQASFGRRQMRLDILNSESAFEEKLALLRADGMQIVWQSRGIGAPIVSLIREQTAILSAELKEVIDAENRLIAPFRNQIDELNTRKRELEVRESELAGELKRTKRQGKTAEAQTIQKIINVEQNPEQLVEIRKAIKDSEGIIKDIREMYKNIRDNVLKSFKPDLEVVLKNDPRCQNRSGRDSKYIRQVILDIIIHCAVKGLEI